ncbi:MAG: hypothetical protein Q7S16_00015 [bacterium]|nr:hypothetical protein [bacterium]
MFISNEGDDGALLAGIDKAVRAGHAITADEIAQWEGEFLRELQQHGAVVVDLDSKAVFTEKIVVDYVRKLFGLQQEKPYIL